jgi:CheY-like chemotaxis protein
LSRVGRILLIDDDDLVRSVARRILRSAGHEVLECGDGKAGVACYRQETRVDLVITDILMPEQEGLETIRELRRIDPQVKIIATSGSGQGDYLDLAVRFGARRILIKPYSRDDLLAAVNEVLAT